MLSSFPYGPRPPPSSPYHPSKRTSRHVWPVSGGDDGLCCAASGHKRVPDWKEWAYNQQCREILDSLGEVVVRSTLSVSYMCYKTTHGIALGRQGHRDGQVNDLLCHDLQGKRHKRSAKTADSHFPVLTCPASAQSQLCRCEHHAPLSAYACVFDHTVRLQHQIVFARSCCTAEWQNQKQRVAGGKVAYAALQACSTIGTQFQAKIQRVLILECEE